MKITSLLFGIICFLPICSHAADKVVVVPLGSAVGDASVEDVIKGKTFSNSHAKGLTGVLELPVLPPSAQTYTNQNGMTFNLIPAGTFIMGSPDGSGSVPAEPGRDPNEIQHEVTLTKPFYMQVTEVTQKQWQDMTGGNPSQSNQGDNYPVETVGWFEAAYFANLLSASENPPRTLCYDLSDCSGTVGVDYICNSVAINSTCNGYRLPTEAEWEYSARAGTTVAYANPFSFDATNEVTNYQFNSNLHAMGWYEFNNESGDLSRVNPGYPTGTKPVAQKQANNWGLYDMHGNVYEWCQDWYKDDYYTDPGSSSDPEGPISGTYRVMRGGGWDYFADHCRSAHRSWGYPDDSFPALGFRLVLPAGE